jgi:hypothetical protein
VNYVLDHPEHKSAAATAHPKQDVAYSYHEKSDLKDWVGTLKDRYEMMG